MFKFSRKVLPAIFLILAMLLGAWSIPQKGGSGSGSGGSGGSGGGQDTGSAPSTVKAEDLVTDKGDLKLHSSLGQVSGLQDRIDKLAAMSVDTSSVTAANLTEFDKAFIEDSLTSNSEELWSMLYTMPKVKNSVVRDVISMMIAQHTKDLKDTIKLAQQVGIDTTVDFTKASVYPETPSYDLGVRTEDMKSEHLDFLTMRPNVSYDDVVLHILDEEHTADIEGELTAERLVSSLPLKAMAKHSADVTELHLQILGMVSKVVSLHFSQVPAPDFSADYMSPFIITIQGQSNSTDMPGGNGQVTPTETATPSTGDQSGQPGSTVTP